MSFDRIILYSSIILAILLLVVTIPRNKIRIALVGILFKQILTWILGIITVEFGLLWYPIRLFEDVNRTSFTFEYVVYPAVCAIFIVHYPEHRSKLFKFGYYATYCSILTSLETILLHYTHLIRYIHWEWYWTWISLFLTFWLSRLFYVWYFHKLLKLPQAISE